MLKKAPYLILLFLLIASDSAHARVAIIYSSQGVQHFSMTIPDNWRINVGSATTEPEKGKETEARLITAVPGDGTALWFGMWVPTGIKNFREAQEHLDSLGLDLLSEVETTERKFDTLNGMEVYYASGTGKREGEIMDFHGAFVQLSAETVAIAIYIGPHESTVTHGDDLKQMFLSLQSLKNTPGA